jgi:hypothetical protein
MADGKSLFEEYSGETNLPSTQKKFGASRTIALPSFILSIRKGKILNKLMLLFWPHSS